MKFQILLLFVAQLLSCCRAAKPVDCHDIHRQNPASTSGVYTISPINEQTPVQADCDMETHGGRWTVFQRRQDGTRNFYRPWDAYVAGFGDATGELWLGLDNLHKITARRPQELLVEMEDFEGNTAFARYSWFSVGGDCDGYKLNVTGFTNGGAGDSLSTHNGMKFSTFDNDQDISASDVNCAKRFLGGFWYAGCLDTNPNGIYRWGFDNTIQFIGVEWSGWKGWNYSLKFFSMKTRPIESPAEPILNHYSAEASPGGLPVGR